MDELTDKLGQILKDPDSFEKIKSVAASLGLMGDKNKGGGIEQNAVGALLDSLTKSDGKREEDGKGEGKGIDAAAIASLLSTLGKGDNKGALDTGSIASLLSSFGKGDGKGIDASTLTSLVSGMSGGQRQEEHHEDGGLLGSIDPVTVAAIVKALSSAKLPSKDIELLRALRAHFGPERAKKVDDAIKIMQLIQLLPMIKDLGIFGGDSA